MIFSARISNKLLGQFCRRLGTSLEAGLDLRMAIERERSSGSKTYRQKMAEVHSAVCKGDSLTESLKGQGGYFPKPFYQMVYVGERTGRLDHILTKMADYYERLHRLKGIFLLSITWPCIQLAVAVCVVGLLIWITGWIASSPGEEVDLLGLGLVGTSGLVKYILFINLLAVGLVIFGSMVRRGFLLTQITNLLMRLPGVGPALRIMAQLRFARTLGLSIESGLDAWNSVGLAFESTQSDYYMRHAADAKKSIRAGEEIHQVLRRTDAFSPLLMDTVQVGEESGRLAESLETHCKQLDDQVKLAFQSLTFVAAASVWVMVAAFIIFLIFRLASFYLGIITNAIDGF